MGRPPSNGAPSFRFNHTEVAQMEVILREHEGQVPTREYLVALAEKFSNAPERAGKVTVQMKQAWNWFQNRRYALRSKLVKSPGKLNLSPMPREELAPVRNVPHARQQIPVSSGHNIVRSASETSQMEFEAKSARDGAWYDVQAFLSHRYLETGNPEVLVRFAGFGPEEDEWINVRKHVRQRSLPCESSECVAVCPADLILCFQEGKEQALYFDAHVLDAQRRRHDIRGCRCRFLVRYDHDQSEEIVPLRKICRRPETDHRLQILHAANEAAAAAAAVSLDLQTQQKPSVDPSSSSSTILRVANPNPTSTPSIAPPPPFPSNNISPPVGLTAPSPFPPVGPTAPSPFPLVMDPTSSPFLPVGPTAPSPFPLVVDSTPPSSLPSVGPTAPPPFASVAPTALSSLPSVGPTTPSPFPSVAPTAPSSLPTVGPTDPSSLPSVGPTDPSSLPSVGPTALSTPTPVAVTATATVPVPVPVPVSTPDVQVPVPDPSLPIPVSVSETSKVQSDTPGVSIDEAASQENIACSSEARKTESVSVLSNPPLEQVVSDSTKAIAEMPGEPEKSECGSNSGHPELQGASATLPTEDVEE